MRLLVFFILFTLVLASSQWDEIDWSLVIPRQQEPGFWNKIIPELRPPPSDPRRSSRIRGGWEVEPNSHPYAVALLMSTATSTLSCGSSIISSRAILTAAHCPVNTLSTLAIMGAHNLQIIEPTQQRRTIPSTSYRIHRNFNPITLANDIAILIMPTVHETPYIRYSRLPHDFRDEMFFGEMTTVVGWGRTCTNCPTSNVLRGVTNVVITTEACREYFRAAVNDNFMCMKTGDVGGTCPGDSGGPYTVERPGSPNLIQVAIHSFGASSAIGGCDLGWPSGSTRTTVFLDWIDENINP